MKNRKTKIICTLGPSSSSYEKIKELALAGMNVARVNFSHGTPTEHLQHIQLIRQVSLEIQKPIAILQDLQGPKIRIQKFENKKIELKQGQDFILSTRDLIGNKEIVSVSYKEFTSDVTPGDTVLLDDGLIHLQVEKVDQSDALCKVIVGGILSENKGINLPGNKLSVAPLTKKDIENLTFGIRYNVDYIALSFVQNAEDVKQLKEKISELESDIPVIAKIEKPQAVECINEIVSIADAIMIARGDLGVELSAEKVPPIQKQIINLCNKRGIPVITATQMLDSMIHNPRPTRAEASDVANAVLDGSDAVMLSGETATGKYPIDAVKMMDKIINLIENDKKLKNSINLQKLQEEIYSPPLAIGHAACSAAQLLNAKAIVCLTQSGSTARIISRFRPENSIIAITSKDTTLLRLSLIWGVNAHSVGDFKNNIDDAISDIKKILLTKTAIEKGDIIVITAGLPFRKKRKTNMLRIEEV